MGKGWGGKLRLAEKECQSQRQNNFRNFYFFVSVFFRCVYLSQMGQPPGTYRHISTPHNES